MSPAYAGGAPPHAKPSNPTWTSRTLSRSVSSWQHKRRTISHSTSLQTRAGACRPRTPRPSTCSRATMSSHLSTPASSQRWRPCATGSRTGTRVSTRDDCGPSYRRVWMRSTDTSKPLHGSPVTNRDRASSLRSVGQPVGVVLDQLFGEVGLDVDGEGLVDAELAVGERHAVPADGELDLLLRRGEAGGVAVDGDVARRLGAQDKDALRLRSRLG